MAKVFYFILFTLIGLLMVAVLGVTTYTFKGNLVRQKADFSKRLSNVLSSIYEMIKNKDLIDHEIACSIKKSSKGIFFDIE